MGFAATEDEERSPALKLDGVGMMDVPNGQSVVSTAAATISEVCVPPTFSTSKVLPLVLNHMLSLPCVLLFSVCVCF